MATRCALLAAFVFAIVMPAHAEMLEFAAADGTKVWPKLPAVSGWHQDQQASFQFTANALIPDGATFADSDATILARGVARGPKSLSQLMDEGRAGADAAHVVKPVDVADKDGRPFTVVALAPAGSGKWEANAYAEEGRYYLLFTLSARSKDAYNKAYPVFAQMLQSYAEMIPW